jgi:hypothetical protein
MEAEGWIVGGCGGDGERGQPFIDGGKVLICINKRVFSKEEKVSYKVTLSS